MKQIPSAASGAHAVLLSPVVVNQRIRIQKDMTVRELVGALRADSNRLHEENDKLIHSIDIVEEDARRLKEVKEALEDMCTTQETSLDNLLNNTREFEQINKEMMKVIKKRAWEEVTSIVMEADTNHDFILSDNEIDGLIFRLKFVETLHINEQELIKNIKENNGSIKTVLDLLKKAFDENSPKRGSAISVKDASTFLSEQRSLRNVDS